jgi:hypothetical protein
VTIVFDPLWSSLIAPVARIEFRDMQTLKVFLKSLTDERGPIQVLPLCRYVRCFQEPYVEKNCTIFIVAFMIAVFAQRRLNLSVHSRLRAVAPVSELATFRQCELFPDR